MLTSAEMSSERGSIWTSIGGGGGGGTPTVGMPSINTARAVPVFFYWHAELRSP